jgi:hypothetical protein
MKQQHKRAEAQSREGGKRKKAKSWKPAFDLSTQRHVFFVFCVFSLFASSSTSSSSPFLLNSSTHQPPTTTMPRLTSGLLLLLIGLVSLCIVAPLVAADDATAEPKVQTLSVFEDVVDDSEADDGSNAVAAGDAAADDDDDADAEAEEEEGERTRVLQLTGDTFIDLLDTANNLLVLFIDGGSSMSPATTV